MLPCLTKKFFGFECLGCGIQRSLMLLFKGEFMAAFVMYPAIYPLIGLGIYLFLGQFYQIKHESRITSILAILSVVMISLNYIIKHFL